MDIKVTSKQELYELLISSIARERLSSECLDFVAKYCDKRYLLYGKIGSGLIRVLNTNNSGTVLKASELEGYLNQGDET